VKVRQTTHKPAWERGRRSRGVTMSVGRSDMRGVGMVTECVRDPEVVQRNTSSLSGRPPPTTRQAGFSAGPVF
jgi:hypothetical protein